MVGLQVLVHSAGTLITFEVKRFIDPLGARDLQTSLFERGTLRYLMPLPLQTSFRFHDPSYQGMLLILIAILQHLYSILGIMCTAAVHQDLRA